MTGKKFRLPTESEWEYAARGGIQSQGYIYAGSNNINDVAWYEVSSHGKTHEVKAKQPNELGLYDMSGNVYEWCLDYFDFYRTILQKNPQGPTSGSRRVFRGGSWHIDAWNCRVTNRYGCPPTTTGKHLGFRLAL